MKAILQRVKSASVTVDGQVISSIGIGILALVAVGKHDTIKEADALARKMISMRLWDTWKKSVVDIDGEVLVVSQFTLYASTKKGTKPDFHRSAGGDVAREIYGHFYRSVQGAYRSDRVKEGVFQAMMDVALVNDGPVTLEINADPPESKPEA